MKPRNATQTLQKQDTAAGSAYFPSQVDYTTNPPASVPLTRAPQLTSAQSDAAAQSGSTYSPSQVDYTTDPIMSSKPGTVAGNAYSPSQVDYTTTLLTSSPASAQSGAVSSQTKTDPALVDPFTGVYCLPPHSVTFQTDKLLGKGAFGQVCQGKWGDRLVAMKEIDIQLAQNKLGISEEEVLEALQWEVSRLSTVSHPNLVQFYGIYKHQGKTYLVMEFCEGGSLQKVLEHRLATLNWATRWQWALEITQGLAYLHRQGALHRDLKAENVLLDKHHRARLADLGVAQVDALLQRREAKVVEKGFQDQRFIAPEILHKPGSDTTASDIYALGLVFWQLASGQEPRRPKSRQELLQWMQSGEREPIPADCPAEFRALILSCWQMNPEKRPSAEQLVENIYTIASSIHLNADWLKLCETVDEQTHASRIETLTYVAPYVTAYGVDEDLDRYWQRLEGQIGKENNKLPSEAAANPPLVLQQTLDGFLADPQSSTLLLLGESGLGKTLSVYQWADSLLATWWDAFKNHQMAATYPCPIFIRPHLSQWSYSALTGALETALQKHSLDTSLPEFRQARWLFILDGYDECQADVVPQNLPDQLGLHQFPNAKLVVTCRPNTVPSLELKNQFAVNNNLVVRYFLPLNLSQLLDYLKTNLCWDTQTHAHYQEKFQQSHTLRSVLRNPFVLSLLVQSWETVKERDLNQLSRWQVYDGFIEHWLKQQKDLLSHDVQTTLVATHPNLFESFNLFASEIALNAFQQKTLSLSDHQPLALTPSSADWLKLSQLVSKDSQQTFQNRQERLSDQERRRALLDEHDYRHIMNWRLKQFETGALLRHKALHYEFSHKSFYEYFIAVRLWRLLNEEVETLAKFWKVRPLTEERPVIDFLVEFYQTNRPVQSFETKESASQQSEDKLFQLIDYSKQHKEIAQASSNAATTLNAVGIAFTGRDLSEIAIPGADLTNAIFDHANLEGADLSGVNFSLAWLAFANFKGANLKDVQWGEQVDWLGHRGAVNAVVLSPDKKTLASGGADGDIRLWDVKTGQCKQILPGQKQRMAITCLDFTPDSKQLVSGCEDHGVRLWRLDTGQLVREYDKGSTIEDIEKKKYFNFEIISIDKESEINSVFKRLPAKTYVLVEKRKVYHCYYIDANHKSIRVSVDHELVRLNKCSKESLREENQDKLHKLLEALINWIHIPKYGASHQDTVTAVQVSFDGKYIYSTSYDGLICHWHLKSDGINEISKADDSSSITALQAPLDSISHFAAGTIVGKINLFNFCPQQVNCLHGAEGAVRSIRYHPKGHTILAGGDDGVIYTWFARENFGYDSPYLKMQECSPEHRQSYRGHNAAVTGLFYSQDAEWIVSSSLDHSVRLWQSESGRCTETVEHARASIRSFALDERSEGRLVYTADADGRIRKNLLQGHQRTQIFRHRGSIVQVLALTQSLEWISLGKDNKLVWHSADGRLITANLSLPAGTQALVSDSEGSNLFAIDASGVIYWHQQNVDGQTFHCTELTCLPNPPSAIACSSDANDLFIAVDSQLHRYTVNPFVREQTYSNHHGIIRQVIVQNDRFYTVAADGLLCAWSFKQATPLWSQTAHNRAVSHLAVNQHYIATAGTDNSVALWQASSGKFIHRWIVPVRPSLEEQGVVVALAFKQDGNQLAVLLKSRYILLFDTNTSERLSAFMINASIPQSMAVREDTVLIGDEQGHLQWWQWHTPYWRLLRRTQPQLLAQYSRLDYSKGLTDTDHHLLGQRFAQGQAQATSRLLSLLLDSDLIGLEQHLQDYPDSFDQSVLGSQQHLLDYAFIQGSSDVLPLLFSLAPESLLQQLAKRDDLFESLIEGNLRPTEAAQIMVSLLALKTRGFCPKVPKNFGPYPTSALQQRCDEVLQIALALAIQTEELFSIDSLLNWSVDVKAPIAGRLPLYYAVVTGNKAVVERLLSSGATLADKDEQGESALFWAIRLHKYELAKSWLVLEQLNKTNYKGLTPAHLMTEQGWLEGLKTLSRDQLMVADNNGLTPLHYAAKQGHLAIFDYYKNQGIPLEQTDIQGHTPLVVALQHNQLHLVKRLMTEQYAILMDEKGQTLLHLAITAGASECVVYLLSIDTIAAFRYQPDHVGNTPLLLALESNIAVEPFLDQASINFANESGETPLLLAIRHQCSIEKIDMLLQAGAEVNVQANNRDTPLNLAVQQQNLVVVEKLIIHGASLDTTNQEGDTSLHLAILQGNIELITRLLTVATSTQINRENKTGESPWLLSVALKNVNLMQLFLSKGAEINAHAISLSQRKEMTAKYAVANLLLGSVVDMPGFNDIFLREFLGSSSTSGMETALYHAAALGYADIVQFLLNQGADVNCVNLKGITPIYAACTNQHEEVVRLLLDHGSNPNQIAEDGSTLLLKACQNGNQAISRLLLDRGSAVDIARKDGVTPFWVACQSGSEETVHLLMNRGANINQADNRGITPLWIACSRGHEKVACLLLKYEALINVQRDNGSTALWIACAGGHELIVRLLLEQGANVRQTDYQNITPLGIACQQGYESLARLFLEQNTLEDIDRSGFPLWAAGSNGHEEIVKLLLRRELGEDQSTKISENGDKYGKGNVLHRACLKGHEKVVRLLLEHRVDVNTKINKNTALLIASGCGHEVLVRLLLEYRANVNQANDEGATPLVIASQNGYETIVGLLLEHGANVDVRSEYGTALYRACYNGHEAIVHLLLKWKASISIVKLNNDSIVIPLVVACAYGHENIARLLLSRGAPVDQADSSGMTPLLSACQNGYEMIVQLLLEWGADVNYASDNEEVGTPLFKACKNGHETIVCLLLKHGAHVNQAVIRGITPFQITCLRGHAEIAGLLLDRGIADGNVGLLMACHQGHEAVVDLLLKRGIPTDISLLAVACEKGHEGVVRVLLSHGIDVNVLTDNGSTSFLVACKNGHESVIRLLLDGGAHINLADKDEGSTPLWVACANGHEAAVRLLLEQGASVDTPRNDGITPLWIACYENHASVARLLFEKGASVDAPRNDGITPLYVACKKGHEIVVRLLLEHGAGVDTADEDDATLLWIASKEGHEGVVRLLLEKGVSADQANKDGITPLWIACQEGHESLVRLLFENGVSVDQANKDGFTPIFIACLRGYASLVHLLLENGAHVDQANKNGITPLYIACQEGHESVVRLLLEKGSSVDQTTNDGITPLFIAQQNGHAEVVETLLQAGADCTNLPDINSPYQILISISKLCLDYYVEHGRYHFQRNFRIESIEELYKDTVRLSRGIIDLEQFKQKVNTKITEYCKSHSGFFSSMSLESFDKLGSSHKYAYSLRQLREIVSQLEIEVLSQPLQPEPGYQEDLPENRSFLSA